MRTTGISRGLVRTAAFAVTAGLVGSTAFAAATNAPRKEPRTAFTLSTARALSFESNEGQIAAPVRFAARGEGYTLWLSPGETSMSFRKGSRVSSLRVKLVGADESAAIVGLDRQQSHSNYYVGAPSQWREGVPHFGRVAYHDVYPGVNLVHYGNEGVLEYDFVVAPGADPSAIRLSVEGASKIQIQKNGDLLLKTATGEVVHRAPLVYQERDGVRTPVSGRFVLENKNQVRFEVGAYDARLALVIDPVLTYSTYLGGLANTANDQILAVAASNTVGAISDPNGFAFVAGTTSALAFPTRGTPAQPTRSGAADGFVSVFNATGSDLVYSTYLGGTLADAVTAIAADANGNAYVTGTTLSTNFPTFGTPFQATHAGTGADSFVVKLGPTGAFVYSTLLGGNAAEDPESIAIDNTGNAYVAGTTASADFPTTLGPAKSGTNDAYVTKLNTTGSALIYSRRVGGNQLDLAFGVGVDTATRVYVTGSTTSTNFPTTATAFQKTKSTAGDAFLTRLDAAGNIDYSTYFGGNQADVAFGLDLGIAGNPYITGRTHSTVFPTKNAYQKINGGGNYDAFVAKFLPDAATAPETLAFSTFVGGPQEDIGNDLEVGDEGYVYVVGQTAGDFPVKNAVQGTYGGGAFDAFAFRLSPSGQALTYSTYLGGDQTDGAFGMGLLKYTGNVFVGGVTTSRNFPVDSAFQAVHGGTNNNNDGFLSRLPFVDVVGPIDTTVFAVGTTRQIRWFTSLPSSETVEIEVSDDGGGSWTNIASGVPATSESFDWFVAGVAPTTDGRVRVTWSVDAKIFSEQKVGFAAPVINSIKLSPSTPVVQASETLRLIVVKHNLGSQAFFKLELDRDGVLEDIDTCASPGEDANTSNANEYQYIWDPEGTATVAHTVVTWYTDACVTLSGVTATSPAFAIVP